MLIAAPTVKIAGTAQRGALPAGRARWGRGRPWFDVVGTDAVDLLRGPDVGWWASARGSTRGAQKERSSGRAGKQACQAGSDGTILAPNC